MKHFAGKQQFDNPAVLFHTKKLKFSKELSFFIQLLIIRTFLIKCTFTFSIFPLYQPGIKIAHNARGHYGKIRPRVLANRSVRYIFTSSSHIIKRRNNGTTLHFNKTDQSGILVLVLK